MSQIFCDDTADKNCPAAKEPGVYILVREKLCKLDFFHWFLALLVFQLWGLHPVQYCILMCPVYETICVSFGLNSHQNVMVNVITNHPLLHVNAK